jgi:diguanylate cyclase (GGDEF)-like protein
MRDRPRTLVLAKIMLGAGALLLASIWVQALTGVGGETTADFFARWVYDGVFLAAVGVCVVVAIARPDRRLASGLLAIALLSSLVGSVIYSLAPDIAEVPVPSISDPLWLAPYPLEYAALVVLTRRQAGRTLWATRLDGLLSGLAVAAALACVSMPAVIAVTAGDSLAARATAMAYPLADLVLLGAVVSAIGLTGWRPNRTWYTFGGAILAWEIADHIYLFDVQILAAAADALVTTGALGIALAMVSPPRQRRRATRRSDRGLFVPVAFGLLSLGILILHIHVALNGIALALAAASLLVVLVRMAIALRENRALLDASQIEATTDALTGLANRRRLTLDLAEVLRHRDGSAPHVLVLLDLNGFKLYNDDYGHLAGDGLLARLAGTLTDAVAGKGTAYRLGGDEFCVLAPISSADVGAFAAACADGLASHGEGFTITAAYGVVVVPEEAGDPSEVLTLADQRMYRNKNSTRWPAARQSMGVLTALLEERDPDMARRSRAVADLACALGADLGIHGGDLEVLRQAATLHGIGTIAIPDAVLGKPGELTDADWRLVRRHPVIAERILAAVPALAAAARIVRSVHERVDGTGYPQCLTGEEIPLASRVILVASAFCAMTSHRRHAPTRTTIEALEELRRFAGTQFDADVVAALARNLAAPDRGLAALPA